MNSNGNDAHEGIPVAPNLWPPAIATAIKEECVRLNCPTAHVVRSAGLPDDFIADASMSLYDPRISQLRLAAKALGVPLKPLIDRANELSRSWYDAGRHQPRRRLHFADVGRLLSDTTPRNTLIACSVVPDFTHGDVVDALALSPTHVDAVLNSLLDLGAIHRAPGPPSNMTTYTVQNGVRGVILSAVKGGFKDATGPDRPAG